MLKLVGSNGAQSYVPLTIRDDSSRAALVIQNSVTTWQAYNDWGGYSLYHGPGGSFGDRSRVVSFDRPYEARRGSGDLFWIEAPVIYLAERLGLDVTYWTDIDLHQRPGLLMRHRALISLGHDEYWSSAMRRGALFARSHGVNLAFLGANDVYRHIRLEASPLGEDRREVNYKVAAEDPLYGVDDDEVTSQWREGPVPRPESLLLGGLYQCNPVTADMVVSVAVVLGVRRDGTRERRPDPRRDPARVRPRGRPPADPGLGPDPRPLTPHVSRPSRRVGSDLLHDAERGRGHRHRQPGLDHPPHVRTTAGVDQVQPASHPDHREHPPGLRRRTGGHRSPVAAQPLEVRGPAGSPGPCLNGADRRSPSWSMRCRARRRASRPVGSR